MAVADVILVFVTCTCLMTSVMTQAIETIEEQDTQITDFINNAVNQIVAGDYANELSSELDGFRLRANAVNSRDDPMRAVTDGLDMVNSVCMVWNDTVRYNNPCSLVQTFKCTILSNDSLGFLGERQELGYCTEKVCMQASDCNVVGAQCLNNKCVVSTGTRMYAAACKVRNSEGVVVKERPCAPGVSCGCTYSFVMETARYTGRFCEPRNFGCPENGFFYFTAS